MVIAKPLLLIPLVACSLVLALDWHGKGDSRSIERIGSRSTSIAKFEVRVFSAPAGWPDPTDFAPGEDWDLYIDQFLQPTLSSLWHPEDGVDQLIARYRRHLISSRANPIPSFRRAYRVSKGGSRIRLKPRQQPKMRRMSALLALSVRESRSVRAYTRSRTKSYLTYEWSPTATPPEWIVELTGQFNAAVNRATRLRMSRPRTVRSHRSLRRLGTIHDRTRNQLRGAIAAELSVINALIAERKTWSAPIVHEFEELMLLAEEHGDLDAFNRLSLCSIEYFE